MSVRNVLDFETALQSSPELAALARGNRLSPGVSVSHPPLPPHTVAVRGRAPGEGCAAPRPHVNGSRAFWKKLVLVPNTFPTEPRPLNQRRLTSTAAGAGTVELGQLSKTKQETFLPWGGGEEREGGLFSICCNFITKRTLASPGKKGPKEKLGALGRCHQRRGARDAGGVRIAGRRDHVSGFGRPHEGRVTVARGRGVRRPRRSVPYSWLEALRCAEQERGTKERSGEGSQLGEGEPPAARRSRQEEAQVSLEFCPRSGRLGSESLV